MYKNFLRLLIVSLVFLLFACEEISISLVKKAPVPIDKSLTYEKLFETYAYCANGSWKSFKTDRGQTIVEWQGEYSPEEIARQVLDHASITGIDEEIFAFAQVMRYLAFASF